MVKKEGHDSGSHLQGEIGAEGHLPGMIEVLVSGLRPAYKKWGSVGSNLLKVLPNVRAAVLEEEWYPKLLRDVRQGKKKAVVITALGSLAIFVAAAGIELGLRHGHDLAAFDKLLKRGKKK